MSANQYKEIIQSIDPIIHHPSRYLILNILSMLEYADFKFFLRETGLTKGNLSSHMAKLENGGYVAVEKTYKGKIPVTLYKITANGETALREYKKNINKWYSLKPSRSDNKQ